jgi:hypothetical protein
MRRLFLTSIGALFLATGAAHAETDVLGCFVRAYDKAHLAKHPDQLVTSVKLHIYHPSPGEGTPPLNEAEAKNATWMKLELKVRGRDVTLTSGAICREEEEPPDNPYLKHPPPPDALRCRVECDGGGIGVASRGDHEMMYLDRIMMSVKKNDYSCGGETVEELLGNKDDHVF